MNWPNLAIATVVLCLTALFIGLIIWADKRDHATLWRECRHCGWQGYWGGDECGICPGSLLPTVEAILTKPDAEQLFPRTVTQKVADALKKRQERG